MFSPKEHPTLYVCQTRFHFPFVLTRRSPIQDFFRFHPIIAATHRAPRCVFSIQRALRDVSSLVGHFRGAISHLSLGRWSGTRGGTSLQTVTCRGSSSCFTHNEDSHYRTVVCCLLVCGHLRKYSIMFTLQWRRLREHLCHTLLHRVGRMLPP